MEHGLSRLLGFETEGPRRTGGSEELTVQCPECNKTFSGPKRKYYLSRHRITHTDEKPFACPICPYRANIKENLIRHMKYSTTKHAQYMTYYGNQQPNNLSQNDQPSK